MVALIGNKKQKVKGFRIEELHPIVSTPTSSSTNSTPPSISSTPPSITLPSNSSSSNLLSNVNTNSSTLQQQQQQLQPPSPASSPSPNNNEEKKSKNPAVDFNYRKLNFVPEFYKHWFFLAGKFFFFFLSQRRRSNELNWIKNKKKKKIEHYNFIGVVNKPRSKDTFSPVVISVMYEMSNEPDKGKLRRTFILFGIKKKW